MSIHKVLLVDDDPDIRTIGRLSLANVGGMDVTVVGSGLEGIDQARSAKPDVILLDVMMPELDGPSTLERLRADPALRSIPVIFMTAKAQPREVAQYEEMGAAGVIAKPFNPMTLAEEVRRLVG
jgi:two-component system, OmpR family, response regulator